MYYIPPRDYIPHAYQREGTAFLLRRDAALLLWDPGLGKTSATLQALSRLIRRGEAKRVLILAPLRVALGVWPEEVKKWLQFYQLRVEVLHGPKKDAALARHADIYVMNYEGLPWLLGEHDVPGFIGLRTEIDRGRWAALRFDTLVMDEISRLRHVSSQRFKLLKRVLPTFRRRWGLTGSPAANGLEGLFGQAYAVDIGRTFGPYITHFRTKYFIPDGFDYRPQPDGAERIYADLSPLALRTAAEDHLDLPELVQHIIRVDLPPAARKAYDEMEKDLLTAINTDVVAAATTGAALSKCRQIASGGLYLDSTGLGMPRQGPRKTGKLHSAKTDALAELVDELQGQQLLVTYEFHHDLARLQARFGDDIAVIGGGTSTKAAGTIISDWNAGRLRLLFGHPASMGHGLNLQGAGCAHVCHYSPTWDFELWDQVNRRILRQGTTAHRVVVHSIVARDTVDEMILGMLRAKNKEQQSLFSGLKRYAEEKHNDAGK